MSIMQKITSPASGVLASMGAHGHEQVVHGFDPATGLRAIVAIHSTALGPALGGTRIRPYETEEEALADALRLSEAMSLKAAAAGLDFGGGKAVVIGDPATVKTPELLVAFGHLVDGLCGRYITAEDVGTTVEDMRLIRKATPWVTGLPRDEGGSGDPSPLTARGVLAAMRAVAEHLWSTPSLRGRKVALQGIGKVGGALLDLLLGAGVEVVISDLDTGAARRAGAAAPGVRVVDPDEILAGPCDILAPCALGGILDDRTIPRLRCSAIVGSANNQLAREDHADALAARGILYAPDFVVNAGGIINIAVELEPGGYVPEEAVRRVDRIFENMRNVLERAAASGVTPAAAATALARERIARARHEDTGERP